MKLQVNYISAQQAADKWGISNRRVRTLCSDQRIPNAVRIGNMWVVPEDAQKPSDARKRNINTCHNAIVNPIKTARKSLRDISVEAYEIALRELNSPTFAKKSVLVVFVQELVNHFTFSDELSDNEGKNKLAHIYKMFDMQKQLSSTAFSHIREIFRKFLFEHPFCIDDSLSWAYQFVSKRSLDTGLEHTQFFTEKYMIATLIDQSKQKINAGKILDPACGGGNFLLYSLDYLCDVEQPQEIAFREIIRMQLERLYGYDLDPMLALVASINLRVKVLAILKNHDYKATFEDFFAFCPNIYHSVNKNFEGALDINGDTHKVVRAGTNHIEFLSSVIGSADLIFTNPPFQSVKGMNESQKVFLKENYPNVKCDMCNAFIEFALKAINKGGTCGLVTQNSWMYLESFKQFRLNLLQEYTFESIIELGSNAFYDINGEKSNVALVTIQKRKPTKKSYISMYSLRHLMQEEIESLLSSGKAITDHMASKKQLDVIGDAGSGCYTLSTTKTQLLYGLNNPYGNYAVPMQGTSTGDSKSFVSYFWEHFGNPDWCPVSKGGGFSRWLGLNSYCVKWGNQGEYIKEMPGSAIRNAKHFGNTQLVFSDTGTAGLNVRLLRENQIFIASGPGIRIETGYPLAHMAFLNSRYSSFIIRLLSPKLTIAAGYIAKIPTLVDLLTSDELEQLAGVCVAQKEDRLSKRPINLEFVPLDDCGSSTTLNEQALKWFLSDIESEWLQLDAEGRIDRVVADAYGVSASERERIDMTVGCHALDITHSKTIAPHQLDRIISELLSTNCTLVRTRPNKNNLGCDSVLEYVAHKSNISPSIIKHTILQNSQSFSMTLAKYLDAHIHNIILSTLGYSGKSFANELPMNTNTVIERVANAYPSLVKDLHIVEKWIKTRLDLFHRNSFFDKPLIHYCIENDMMQKVKENNEKFR